MIIIPDLAWSRMLDEFAKERRGVEQVCYFDGVEIDANVGVVTTVTIPNADVKSGNFHVSPEAMSQAGRHMRTFRLRRLAQIHTHPNEWTGHSSWDNEWAYSQLPGAVSIVLPHFARFRPSLVEAGVHLRTDLGWRELTSGEAANVVRTVPSLLDFRRASRNEHDGEHIVDRHEGDLGWLFLTFGDSNLVGVKVVVVRQSASMPCTEHTAWMLVNLLARLTGVVRSVAISCPRDVQLAGRVVPLSQRNIDLRTALLEGGQAVGAVPVHQDQMLERIVVVGPSEGEGAPGTLHVWGNAWCGGIQQAPFHADVLGEPSGLPFGPYAAACIAVGEVFKAARMNRSAYVSPESAFFSVWDFRASDVPIVSGPSRIDVSVDSALAGVGAVGCSFLHGLWACNGVSGRLVLIDNDANGVEATNLNRYVLFGSSSIGKAKASEASRILSDSTIQWEARDEGIEVVAVLPERVISAVDRNASRHAIQNRYPARIMSGSTQDLRAEVLRCGPPGVGACLRCFNPLERVVADDELRRHARSASEANLSELAAVAGISVPQAKEWIATGRCGIPGERLLPHLRFAGELPAFAVGFVSVMAGTMLSAAFIKDHLEYPGPLSDAAQRATYQFHSPLAPSNRAWSFSRDPRCPMCSRETVAGQMWARRFEQLMPRHPS